MNAILLMSFCLVSRRNLTHKPPPHTTNHTTQGNILGPLTFRNEDAPRYIPAKLSIVVVDSVAIGTTVLLLLYYRWQNKTRDAAAVEHIRDVEFADLTDRENKEFRYKY
jgi:hypothetical protein